MKSKRLSVYGFLIFVLIGSCMSGLNDDSDLTDPGDEAVFLLIDEDSIDNGLGPNDFSETDVNDDLASVGLRQQLRFFADNVGQTIDLYSGQVGDEAWFALTNAPNTWINAGPTGNGIENLLAPGPGLGSPNIDDDREVLLDEIPNVIPLRATGLKMLVGKKVLALVYDSDISINYSPIEGNLKGGNLGLIAFEVLDARDRLDASSSSLPILSIRILNANAVREGQKVLFANPPIPQSSSEPFDIKVPSQVNSPEFILAN
jgi:hypothetical protein